MKSTSNKQIAVIFKEAKKYLALNCSDSKYSYICMAIDEVAVKDSKQWENCVRAKFIISERLNGKYTVREWLIANGFRTSDDEIHSDQMQKYRHRWLDSLIKEFSK
jgi:hypothetical protein